MRALSIAAVAAVLVVAGCGSSDKSKPSAAPTPTPTATSAGTSTALISTKPGPEGVPLELGAGLTGQPTIDGQPHDGVQCNTAEQLVYHVHAHLAVYVNGAPRSVPYGIGIENGVAQPTQRGPFVGQGDCFYWLHTHATDGIIHIESPTRVTYDLGQFFAVWGQPLSKTQVSTAKGAVTAYVDGKKFAGDPNNIQLKPHAEIQLDVGTPLVPPQPVKFAGL